MERHLPVSSLDHQQHDQSVAVAESAAVPVGPVASGCKQVAVEIASVELVADMDFRTSADSVASTDFQNMDSRT